MSWGIFRGDGFPHDGTRNLPEAPPWRRFGNDDIGDFRNTHDPRAARYLGRAQGRPKLEVEPEDVVLVNAALYLRRPLLVTGKPGIGKSSLAYAVAHELGLGRVLRWAITSRSTIQDGLYRYDAIGRLQEASLGGAAPDIGKYLSLGPLGTALLPTRHPQVLLIDEIDKSDIDLPNDLLNVFEDGEFEIPEICRLPPDQQEVRVRLHDSLDEVTLKGGRIVCNAFPFVVLTSNGERELPAPFRRRCLHLDIQQPDSGKLARIVKAHFGEVDSATEQRQSALIEAFEQRRKETQGDLATDQLLNAIHVVAHGIDLEAGQQEQLLNAFLRRLSQ